MEKKKHLLLWVLIATLWNSHPLNAQIAYGLYQGNLMAVDLSDCSVCSLFPIPHGGSPDVVVLPDGRVIWTENFLGIVYNSQGVIINSFNCPNGIQSACLHNGTFYLATVMGLYTVNLSNYTVTFIGNWPGGIHNQHYLFSINGNLYTTSGGPIWEVNVTNPSLSVYVQNITPPTGPIRGASGLGGLMYYSTYFPPTFPGTIFSYNLATNTKTQVCLLPNDAPFWGVSILQALNNPLSCPCITSAGAIPSPAINLCGTAPLNGPSTSGPILGNNDILRYFLITNPTNITNSIVSVSTTPNFSFNPATMTQNTTYYLIAGAGDNLNGNINFADTCLNFSNAIPVTWRPLPEVTFTTTNSSLCAGDCEDITVNLTGNPPFSLTYSTPFSGNQVQVFPTNNGLITLCPPVGSPPGSIQLQATALSDAFCTCQ